MVKFRFRKLVSVATLSNSLINCHFDYSSSAWYSSLPKNLKNKLQTSQNKIVRFILNADNRSHVGPEELDDMNWLDVHHRVCQLKLTKVHNIFYDNCPVYMKDKFSKISNVHSYNTRSSSYNFHVPSINGVSAQSFYYTAIILWNSLPNNLKSIRQIDIFKKELKMYYVDEMYRKEAEVFYYY